MKLVNSSSLLLCLSLLAATPALAGPAATTVTSFDALHLEAPESLVVDLAGDIYVSLSLTGEIRRIARDGTQATVAVLPIGQPLQACGPFVAASGPLALDERGDLYVSVDACDPANRGVWHVTPDGASELVANLPMAAMPNGIAYRRGTLYVADSALGVIWSLPADGSAQPVVWADHPLLEPDPSSPWPGPNGLQFYLDELYVSNPNQLDILAITLEDDGSAGAIRVHAVDTPCDDFAFDVHGALYCGTDPFNTLLRVAPDGSLETILTAADGLDGPTAAAFGRTAGDSRTLYFTNAAFPMFSTTHRASLMKVDLGVPGMPRR